MIRFETWWKSKACMKPGFCFLFCFVFRGVCFQLLLFCLPLSRGLKLHKSSISPHFVSFFTGVGGANQTTTKQEQTNAYRRQAMALNYGRLPTSFPSNRLWKYTFWGFKHCQYLFEVIFQLITTLVYHYLHPTTSCYAWLNSDLSHPYPAFIKDISICTVLEVTHTWYCINCLPN